jgi:hypothetical protein
LAPLNRLGNRAPIPDIGPNYFNPGQGQMIDSRPGPFKDANRLTLVDQSLDEVTANEPGAASNKDSACHNE